MLSDKSLWPGPRKGPRCIPAISAVRPLEFLVCMYVAPSGLGCHNVNFKSTSSSTGSTKFLKVCHTGSDAIAELRELVGSEESISARGSAAQKDFLADVGADEFGGEQLV